MSYEIKFPTSRIEKFFDKFLQKQISRQSIRDEILESIKKLGENARPFGDKNFTQIKPPIPIYHRHAQYRLRIGNYRVLYNVDDDQKTVWLLDIRLRSEKTYRR